MQAFRLLEIVCFASVFGDLLIRRCLRHFIRRKKNIANMQDHAIRIIRQIEATSGPTNIFDWPTVSAAPLPSMDVANLEPGQVVL